ncbi:MAG: histone deacetylase [Acidobacteriota bacterium]
MQTFYCDQFVLPLPENHRFPMEKYRLLRERVTAELEPLVLEVPKAASDGQLALAHDPDYIRRVVAGEVDPKAWRRVGFPWSPALVERSRRSAGGTLAASRSALRSGGVAVNLAGGTHHSFSDRGEGFCVFNDAAVAARCLQAAGAVRRVIVIDCDVHQGNGTASIFAGDSSVYTLSIHGARNFPFHKEKSDLDVALADGTGDEEYLECLDSALERAMAVAGADLAIFVAGADPWHGDRFGKLALTKEGLARRDALVFERCAAEHLPVAVAMAGGYAPDLADVVDIHFQTVRAAHAAWRR